MKRGRIIPILAMFLVLSVSGCIQIVPSGAVVTGKGGGSGGLISVEIDGPLISGPGEDLSGGKDSEDDSSITAGDVEAADTSNLDVSPAPSQGAAGMQPGNQSVATGMEVLKEVGTISNP